MEDTTDTDCTHAKIVCKGPEIKSLSKYHDLYLQSDRLLLTDVFSKFWNMYLEIHGLDPSFFFGIRISMARSLKKD